MQGVNDQLFVYVLNPLRDGTLKGGNVAALEFHVPQILKGRVRKLRECAISILSKATKNFITERIHHTEITEEER